MSSLANITSLLAMNMRSSPAKSSLANQYTEASGSEARTDFIKADIVSKCLSPALSCGRALVSITSSNNDLLINILLPWIEAESAASSNVFKAHLASPLDNAAISWSTPSSMERFLFSKPFSESFKALVNMWTMSFLSRLFNVKTLHRDKSGEIISKDGFSVVAPMKVTVPSSTCGSIASCWALLNR